jgi:glycosyltransferase involved in cell wall biosynthesis
MRVLLVGAFPFPYPQGSQVFATAQAHALAAAGAEVSLASYGCGEGARPPDLDWIPSSRALAPRELRSGPSLAKLPADAALLATLVAAQRARNFDVVLAHNAEAAFVAAAARTLTGLRFVYVAHTLFANELACYGSERWQATLRRIGTAIDRRAARAADAVLALTPSSASSLAPHSRGPVDCIPPGHAASEAPTEAAQQRACQRAGLEAGRFVLYSGNLDAYQGLDQLAAAAPACESAGLRLVIATHDARSADAALARFSLPVFATSDREALRALGFAAAAHVAPRRIAGGFPIKLLNAMETGRPIVAYERAAEGLDDECAVLLGDEAGPDELARALCGLVADPARASALGRAARVRLAQDHDWKSLAADTLALAELARA